MQLPPFQLEAGADLTHHVVRTCYAGPAAAGARDRGLLERHLPLLNDVLFDAPTQVVRRTVAELKDVGTLPTGFALMDHAPTVVVVHALTGDARVLGTRGFWAALGSPHGPLDTAHKRVLCINLLGSCYGSSGPCDAGFPRYEDDRKSDIVHAAKGAFQVPVARMPATVTTIDQARSILLALDALGIQRV
jgi:homoserine O-acetyltransferase/O-succinyltransferase